MVAMISATFFLIYINAATVLVVQHGFPRPIVILMPMLLCVPVAYRVITDGEPLRFPSLILTAMVVILCHSLSALTSGRPDIGFENVTTWLLEGVLLAFLVINALRTREEVFSAARAIVAAGALMGLITLVQQILGPLDYNMAGFGQLSSDDPTRVQHRSAGPIGEVNRFAQILAVLIPIAAGLAISTAKQWQFKTAILLIFSGILLTFSRGTLVALFLVIPFALMFGLLRFRHLALAILLGAILSTAMPHIAKRVASIGEVAMQGMGLAPGGFRAADGASRGRVTEMQAAGLLFLEYPLLGAGPGMAPIYYPDYAALVGGKVRPGPRRTHSLYLQLAAETGVIGLLAYLGMFLMVLMQLDVVRRETAIRDPQLWGLVCGLELGLLIFLSSSIFLHAAYIRYSWLLLGLSVAAVTVAEKLVQTDYWVESDSEALNRLESQRE